jgi:hypothetical protein
MQRDLLTARNTGPSVIDENILEYGVMRIDDCHGPHLASEKFHSLHNRVCQTIERNLNRSSRIVGRVGLFADPLVPVVTIAIKSTCSMAVDLEVVTTENECCRLILVTDWEGVIEPVLDICAPLMNKLGHNCNM